VLYSSSHLDGAESEFDVQTGHTVTHSPKTEEVLRILKLNLQPKNRGSLTQEISRRADFDQTSTSAEVLR
jgi:hypothetical protein